jgi:hypothetical protein
MLLIAHIQPKPLLHYLAGLAIAFSKSLKKYALYGFWVRIEGYHTKPEQKNKKERPFQRHWKSEALYEARYIL